jgi:hypothetical protein
MNYHALYGGILSMGLFLGMLFLMECGRRIGVYPRAKDPDFAKAGFGAIEGAILGLLGLVLAFTFSGAGTRFDARRQLIVEETNAIGTAYLRLDMLLNAAQRALRENFRRYVDARLAARPLLRLHRCGHGIRHSRHRIPTIRLDPYGGLRSSVGRSARKYE